MLIINESLKSEDLSPKLDRFWDLSGKKIHAIEATWNPKQGSPVYTIEGTYSAQGWTEWTQGFQFGSALLQFDATGETEFLEVGRNKTVKLMAPHITHMGVHDHGFNNVSTYGNLLRLMHEGRIDENEKERDFYELALKCSGAVQARRWTRINITAGEGAGFIYSFNGPHSLFADTIRSLRALAVGHKLGHALLSERDKHHSLLKRLVRHANTTAEYSVYYGEGRDQYDVRGRVAHESIFNINDGSYRCANSQQGYSPFSTWTRGLAWIMLGYPEQLEFLKALDSRELNLYGGWTEIEDIMLKAARATCDFYIENSPSDGIPYWDTGAPDLDKIGDYLSQPADPFNDHEPVDSSAAAIACQGLLRLGHYLNDAGPQHQADAKKYWQAGLTVLNTLLDEPYLSTAEKHQGLILHSIYHRPNGWDHVPKGSKIPLGEASMWGDYHAREAALYLHRIIKDEPYYTFFGKM